MHLSKPSIPRSRGPASHQGVVSVVIDHNDITQPFRCSSPLQRQGRGLSHRFRMAALLFRDPPLLRRHGFPEECSGHTLPVCLRRVLRSSTSSGRSPQCRTTLLANRVGCAAPPGDAACVWCASNTSMTPVTGQILLAGKGCRTLVCG